MKLESLKTNKNIVNLAKANAILLEEMKETKQFIELFNRNLASRITEHLQMIALLVKSVSRLNETSDTLYSNLTSDLDNEKINALIKEQLTLEVNKINLIKLLKEHTIHVYTLLETLANVIPDNSNSLNELESESAILLESTLVEDNVQLTENHSKYVAKAKSCLSLMTESLNVCCSKMYTSCNDLSASALTSLKSSCVNEQKTLHETFGWWKQSLSSIETRFRNPKNTLLNMQKVLHLTENDIQEMKKSLTASM